jgi:hypothetical protein
MLRRDLDGGGTNVTQFWGTVLFRRGETFSLHDQLQHLPNITYLQTTYVNV